MGWLPISEYRPECGQVVVWLEWTSWTGAERTKAGHVQIAYQIVTASGVVWVTAHDSIPCETTGRRITHFMPTKGPA